MYDFKLITLLVIDEHHRGYMYPVAFCISNKEETPFMTIFFNAVKQNCSDVQILRLMSNDDEAGINAAKFVFGKNVHC